MNELKKTGVLMIVLAMIATIALAMCFLTNQKSANVEADAEEIKTIVVA